MGILDRFYALCLPSKIYLVISIIFLIVSYYHDLKTNDSEKVCLGNVKCAVKNKPAYYAFNVLFILLWSWLLNLLCRYGWMKTAWFILLFPYIIMILLIGVITKMVIGVAKAQHGN